ncbi:MAG: carbohydrate ABC transporter permease, partial [Oscillospiraceae bacterium]|nr:carbohydrate ABC transporter permease [Oscillospiraceae bacterium]
MATRKEEKQFEKEMKKIRKARYEKMKAEGIENYLTPEQIRYNKNKRIVGAVWPIFRFLIIFGLGFVILYPIIFMLSTAFRPSEQMSDPSIVWLPKSFTLKNIEETFEIMNFESTVL